MTFQQQVNKVDKTKNPAPAQYEEQNEYNNVYTALRSQHNGQSYKTFNNPTNEGDEKENSLNKGGLLVKPFIKLHNEPPFLLRNHRIFYNIIILCKCGFVNSCAKIFL
jgi:hypothetical protein